MQLIRFRISNVDDERRQIYGELYSSVYRTCFGSLYRLAISIQLTNKFAWVFITKIIKYPYQQGPFRYAAFSVWI